MGIGHTERRFIQIESEEEPEIESLCCICMDNEISVGLSECVHFFCEDCIKKWLRQEKSCPICRQNQGEAEMWVMTKDNTDEMKKFIRTVFTKIELK